MKRSRFLLLGGSLVALAIIATSIVGFRVANDIERGLVIKASSSTAGFDASAVLEGKGNGVQTGWRSREQTVDSWLDFRWPSSRSLHSLDITTSSAGARITAGLLEFSDGSSLQTDLASGSNEITFGERDVRSLRFLVTAVVGDSSFVGVQFAKLNSASAHVVTDESGDAAPAATLSGLRTTSTTSTPAWISQSADGATWNFHWSAPRELVAIELAGMPTGSTIKRATLRFPGGPSLTVGAVPGDPALTTKVAFLPRSVQWVSVHVDEISGSGELTLSALHLWERESKLAALSALPDGSTVSAPASSCPSSSAESPTSLQVECPVNGAQVGDQTELSVSLPTAATGVRAEVWPSTGDVDIAPVIVSGSGIVRIPLDLASLPEGPLTVQLTALGSDILSAAPVQFQLLHGLGTPTSTPTSDAARGKTLVWDDEFTDPVSVSREDAEHRYAAGKPEPTGYSDFGDAIFADPSVGYGNVGTLARRWLRLGVSPVPSGFTDPQGYDRTHIGALLASAKPGGAGFSAQYGYFEARMLVPANSGTWPAFWMLPSSNLARPEQPVAEIDAVELYGHDPTSACDTSHSYSDGKNSGGVALCGKRFPSARQASQWHTYGVAVEPTRIRYFIDGRQVASAAQVLGGERPMFFLIDLAIGGGWPVQLSGTEQRAQMLVDWVRVFV